MIYQNNIQKLTFLGLTYKPDTDDLRESPALEIAKHFNDSERDLKTFVVEPNIEKCGNLEIVDLKHAVANSELLVLLIKHKEFSQIADNIKTVRILDFTGSFSF